MKRILAMLVSPRRTIRAIVDEDGDGDGDGDGPSWALPLLALDGTSVPDHKIQRVLLLVRPFPPGTIRRIQLRKMRLHPFTEGSG